MNYLYYFIGGLVLLTVVALWIRKNRGSTQPQAFILPRWAELEPNPEQETKPPEDDFMCLMVSDGSTIVVKGGVNV